MHEESPPSLKRQRHVLDQIDQTILEALAGRLSCTREIAQIKFRTGGEIRDQIREATVLHNISRRARKLGLDDGYVLELYRKILDQSVREQEARILDQLRPDDDVPRPTVGYQGVEGSYSSLACRQFAKLQPGGLTARGLSSFAEVFAALVQGEVDYVAMPLANTITGTIAESVDLFLQHELFVVGESSVPVRHCLVGKADVPLTSLTQIYSHPQALQQCRAFLQTLPNATPVSYFDTAGAAEKIAQQESPTQAAIASEEAAQRLDLVVLKRGIANVEKNSTRFLLVARAPVTCPVDVPAKTLIAVGTDAMALAFTLKTLLNNTIEVANVIFRSHVISPDQSHYLLECSGNLGSPSWQAAQAQLAGKVGYLRMLGSYSESDSGATVGVVVHGNSPAPVVPQPLQSPSLLPEVEEVLKKKTYRLVSRLGGKPDSIVYFGDVPVGGSAHPIVIAGPCAVESKEQIHEVAQFVKRAGAHVLRGGCFKPRTSPYDFQGLGVQGLEYMRAAGDAAGLPIITEVLAPEDVRIVAELADVLQIGARNMQNFSLLKEVGRTSRPVLLKRGIMASIDEWLSAAEYILSHGNQQVVLCERGIRTFENSTRNTLDISAVPVVRERSHLPIVVDPSHACGTRRYILDLSRAALAVGAHGVMVEVHPRPAEALSDGPQALTFPMFTEMMATLG